MTRIWIEEGLFADKIFQLHLKLAFKFRDNKLKILKRLPRKRHDRKHLQIGIEKKHRIPVVVEFPSVKPSWCKKVESQ